MSKRISPMKGKKRPEYTGENNPAKRPEVRKIISEKAKERWKNKERRNKMSKCQIGSGNSNWKGDNVSYAGLHAWVRRNKEKPECCGLCGKKDKLEIANISEEYKRDLNDFEWVCRSCHSKKHRGKEWSKKMNETKIKKEVK